MKDKSALHDFEERVFAIQPSYAGFFGMPVPGNAGGSATLTGTSNSATDIIQQLRGATLSLAKELSAAKPDPKNVASLKAAVEGSLMTLQVLDQLSQDTLNSLLAQLDDLCRV